MEKVLCRIPPPNNSVGWRDKASLTGVLKLFKELRWKNSNAGSCIHRNNENKIGYSNLVDNNTPIEIEQPTVGSKDLYAHINQLTLFNFKKLFGSPHGPFRGVNIPDFVGTYVCIDPKSISIHIRGTKLGTYQMCVGIQMQYTVGEVLDHVFNLHIIP